MIQYPYGIFGFAVLGRFHGSALAKAILPAIISTLILYIVGSHHPSADISKTKEKSDIQHPYALGCFMIAYTFMITFRVNFSYNRYWEAANNMHTMMNNWLDVAATVAAYHYQSKMYDSVRPPAFASQEILDVSRNRVRTVEYTPEMLKEDLDEISAIGQGGLEQSKLLSPSLFLSKRITTPKEEESFKNEDNHVCISPDETSDETSYSILNKPRLDGGVYSSHPSLFLQEVTHLTSLMMAVACSTLRNDPDGIELPLTDYVIGSEFPPVDADFLSSGERKKFGGQSRVYTGLNFIFGTTRTVGQRTLYNAARPFGVLGGVSDSEMQLLKSARGPSAKIILCSMWLMEFISREYLAGSTGNVAPPIISRLYQVISNGKLGFEQARKITFVPFPFPHTQIVTFFNLVILVAVPFISYSFVNEMLLACIVNFFTILCFVGLYEVSRELENPFHNVPNDLPLCTYMAHFNEALISTYSGFHPDSWWELPKNYQSSTGHGSIHRKKT